MDKNLRDLAEAFTRLVGKTTNREELNRLDLVANTLAPFFDHPIGNDIWLYVGLQRDANPEMANDYQEDILKMLRSDAKGT